jgi:hypothetical protein
MKVAFFHGFILLLWCIFNISQIATIILNVELLTYIHLKSSVAINIDVKICIHKGMYYN